MSEVGLVPASTKKPDLLEIPEQPTEAVLLTEPEPEPETQLLLNPIQETEAVTEFSGTGNVIYDKMYSAFSQYEMKVTFDMAVSQEEIEKSYGE